MNRDTFHKLGGDPAMCDALFVLEKEKIVTRRELDEIGVDMSNALLKAGWVEVHEGPIRDFDSLHLSTEGIKVVRELKRVTTA